jgi:hypothetical protein
MITRRYVIQMTRTNPAYPGAATEGWCDTHVKVKNEKAGKTLVAEWNRSMFNLRKYRLVWREIRERVIR